MGTEAKRGRLSRMRGAVARTAQKLTSKFRRNKGAARLAAQPQGTQRISSTRGKRPQADVPLDLISNAYTPTQTSLKGPFRSDGDDRQRDQEFAAGFADERWNDEDRITNKSGDPRIGTHGRSYEPGEQRSGRNR